MSDLENGYCPLNGHGVYGGLPARPCPWCQIVELKKAMAESCDDMRFEYAGCERAEAAEAKLAELERGEYICQKCGLRKDAEFTPGDF